MVLALVASSSPSWRAAVAPSETVSTVEEGEGTLRGGEWKQRGNSGADEISMGTRERRRERNEEMKWARELWFCPRFFSFWFDRLYVPFPMWGFVLVASICFRYEIGLPSLFIMASLPEIGACPSARPPLLKLTDAIQVLLEEWIHGVEHAATTRVFRFWWWGNRWQMWYQDVRSPISLTHYWRNHSNVRYNTC